MKKIVARIMILIILVTGIFFCFGTENHVYASNKDEASEQKVYVSDIFYGYSNVLSAALRKTGYERDLMGAIASVQNEYVNSDTFTASTFFTIFKDMLKSNKEIVKYCAGSKELEYMDAANAKFIEALISDHTNTFIEDIDTFGSIMGYMDKIIKAVKDAEEYSIKILDYKDKEKDIETYKNFSDWTWAYLKEYCTKLETADFDTLKTKYYTALSEMSTVTGYTIDALEFSQGLLTNVLFYEMEIEIADDIMQSVDSESLLYEGMERYKSKLEKSFVATFAIDKINDKILGKFCEISKKIVTCDIDKDIVLACGFVREGLATIFDIVMVFFEDYDSYATSVILSEYAREMYDYVESKTQSFNGYMTGKDVLDFKKKFNYCITASKLALKELKKIAKYNTEYNEDYVSEVLKKFDTDLYDDYINVAKKAVAKNPEAWLSEKDTSNTYVIKKDNYKVMIPSDSIEENGIYLFDNQVFGNVKLVDSTLNISEDEIVIIQGNLTIDETSAIDNKGKLIVEGKVESNGGKISNEGEFEVDTLLVTMSEVVNEGKVKINNDFIMDAGNLTNKVMYVDGNATISGINDWFTPDYANINQVGGELNIGKSLYLNGCANLNCSNVATITVDENIVFEPYDGTLMPKHCRLDLNDGIIYCNGYIEEKAAYRSNGYLTIKENGKLYLKGDLLFQDVENNDMRGEVNLCGDNVQRLLCVTVYDVEVTNSKGVKILSDIPVRGKLNMNGYPMASSDSKKLLMYEEAELSVNTMYPIVDYREGETLNYNLMCDKLLISMSGKDFVIEEGIEVNVNEDLNIPVNCSVNIINYGRVNILGDLDIDYQGKFTNHNYLCVVNNLTLNEDNSQGAIKSTDTSFYNYGIAYIYGDISINWASEIHMKSDGAKLYIGGNLNRAQYTWSYDLSKGKVYFVGDNVQHIRYVEYFGIVEINNRSNEGVIFDTKINVKTLFKHNRNKFVLANGGADSVFVDYDGDGMLDNVDEYPTIKYEELSAPEVDLESGEYTKNQIINISSKEGADIYYTLDGTIPSLVNGIKYDGNADVVGVPGKVNNIVLKAICVSPGKKDSKVVEYEYILDLPKLSSPEVPSGLVSTPTTGLGRNDGIISGVTSEMEYSMYSDFRTKTVCEGTNIVGLKPGLYYIRLSETDTTEAGNAAKVVIEEHKHIFEDYIYNEDGTYYQDGTETAVCTCGMSDTKVAEGSKLIDTYAPYISIYIQDKIYNADDNSAEDVLITKEKCSILVEACDLDTNISEISYVVYPYITDEELFGWIRLDNGDSIELLTGENVVYVRAIDEFGNIEYTRTPLITVYDEPECKDSQYITDNIENIDDITFEFDLNETNLKNIKLNNSYIEESFYDMDETGILTLKKEFLSTLQPGVYEFLVMFSPQNDIEEENIITKQLMIEILETEIKENEVVQKPTEDIVNGNDVEAGDVSNRIVWSTMFISITTFLFMSKRKKGTKCI